jgi:hypothetical protein
VGCGEVGVEIRPHDLARGIDAIRNGAAVEPTGSSSVVYMPLLKRKPKENPGAERSSNDPTIWPESLMPLAKVPSGPARGSSTVVYTPPLKRKLWIVVKVAS